MGAKGTGKGWIGVYGYRYICIALGNKKYKQIHEHRYIMEQHIGRKLSKKEHVHHKNGDRLDNRIENLEILSMEEHGKISGKQAFGKPKYSARKPEELKIRTCSYCKLSFKVTFPYVKQRFCSRKCSARGRY